jgi:hypothetical protein
VNVLLELLAFGLDDGLSNTIEGLVVSLPEGNGAVDNLYDNLNQSMPILHDFPWLAYILGDQLL